jgi:hypothetical protein
MLTLQQLLDSDSIATLVAKLNNNFQTIAASNGGPQGIRGSQGIPGLPGKKGPAGATGEPGPTGTIAGIIPFALPFDPGTAGIGPTAGSVVPSTNQSISPWPYSSWSWLQYYQTPGGVGFTGGLPTHGDLYIDHANEGYWKWLEHFDTPGAFNGPGDYTGGGYYYFDSTTTVTYPDLGSTGGWAGTGWYFYPMPQPTAALSSVWEADYTTYFKGYTAGPYPYGPQTDNGASQLKVPNARLVSKYGTVWITSGSDSTPSGGSDTDENFATESIGRWGFDPDPNLPTPAPRPGRYNAGVDRLLFKMSLDNLPYLSNMNARGWTASTNGAAFLESATFPETLGGTPMRDEDYWVTPQYDISMEKFTPLLFLSERTDGNSVDYFSSLGLYMHTAKELTTVAGEGLHKSLFLWSSRAASNPLDMFTGGTPIDSTSTVNYGEFVLDFRRLIASNQYVCSVPTDMRLSSEVVDSGAYTSGSPSTIGNRVYGGYISAINGKAMTGSPQTADYWEFGLGNLDPSGFTAGGTHDLSSGTAGMYTRTNWYGSAVLASKPSDWELDTPGENDYIRVAGMMERGRRYQRSVGTFNRYFSELVFYTSQFRIDNITAGFNATYGADNDIVDPTDNSHKSMPSLYVSPFRNIGIGTFVGGATASNDLGPVEPKGHLHVHTKYMVGEDDPADIYRSLLGSTTFSLPTQAFVTGVFTGEKIGGTASSALILIGNLTSPVSESVNPGTNIVNKFTGNLNSAIRADQWAAQDSSSLRFGTKGSTAGGDINTQSATVIRNEFQLHLHPLNRFASSGAVENAAPVGIGIHNHFPQARFHVYGKNTLNESEVGQQNRTPGGAATGPSGSFPYYSSSLSSPSNNQVVIDYLGSSYVYPVGLKDYGYGCTGVGPGLLSYNGAVYPNRESKSPTRDYIPWALTEVNYSYPSATGRFNGAYKHGGTANAMFPLTSYIGFNIFRDISSADGNTLGDNRDQTRWVIGTSGPNGLGGANNGAAALVFSPDGELGIVTIPKGRDGGRAYQQWEQRGLGTRDVLNNMKVLFDARGNVGVGNAPGWDADAYPSLERNITSGKLNYVPATNVTTSGPTASNGAIGSPYGIAYWNANGRYGLLSYGTAGIETSAISYAARVNARGTTGEYIRFEVAAEKGWPGNGRIAENKGWGYPPNVSGLVISNPTRYIKFATGLPGASITNWIIDTDNEGRITGSTISYNRGAGGASDIDFATIIFPHPIEFTAGGQQSYTGFTAPVGAQAAEWVGMSQAYLDGTYVGLLGEADGSGTNCFFDTYFTPFPRVRANLRLNNYVAGEGSETYTTLDTSTRQESPKLIFTFMEKNPTTSRSGGGGLNPYKKVNTVLLSAQNEASLREYYIPNADNTGGTLMVFTDHLGSKEYNDGIDTQLTSGTGYTASGTGATGPIQRLNLVQVITAELLTGRTGSANNTWIDSRTTNYAGMSGGAGTNPLYFTRDARASIGYVNYFNKYVATIGADTGVNSYFTTNRRGQIKQAADGLLSGRSLVVPGTASGGQYNGGTGATAASYATTLRNIDYYYNVFQGVTGQYNAEKTLDWESQPTQIRFKRINSEFVFVDFNITVEVNNPVLPSPLGTGTAQATAAQDFIDYGVPRMTQSMTFIYNPDEDLTTPLDNDATEDIWGGGPWFQMWSGYKNWLPGSAIVGDETLSLTSLDDYADFTAGSWSVDNPIWKQTSNISTWGGNFLHPGNFSVEILGPSLPTVISNSTLSQGNKGAMEDNLQDQSGIMGEYQLGVINSGLSTLLFGNIAQPVFDSYYKINAFSFMKFLPSYIGTWGNQVMSKHKSCSWRMSPTRWADKNTGASTNNATKNALKIEIIFDEPIMHTAHQFRGSAFDGITHSAYRVTPYKYLTVSGQGIIRYGKTRVAASSDNPSPIPVPPGPSIPDIPEGFVPPVGG